MRRNTIFAAMALAALSPASASAQYSYDPNALVDSWYRTYLGHPPDSGSVGWVNQLQQGMPPDAVLAGIMASDEYYSRKGGTPQGFITGVFTDLFQRSPNPNELNFWEPRLYTEDRKSLILDIMSQNPGTWVGSGITGVTAVQPSVPAVVPPITSLPGAIIGQALSRWNRYRYDDWNRRHGIHDYRRPPYPYRKDHDHEEHRS